MFRLKRRTLSELYELCTFVIKRKLLEQFKFIFNEDRSGRPDTVTALEMIEKIHDIVINVSVVNVREIAETMGISIERVQNILRALLNIKKLSAITP